MMKSSYKQREFLLSRAVMRHALSQHFFNPIRDWEFTERPNSPPLISNLPDNTHISLSHSKGLIGFAISNSPVGIDLELADKRRNFLELAEAFMSNEEIQFMVRNTEKQADIFYRIWCIKEAYYKALCPKNQSNITFKKIHAQTLIENKKDWSLTEGRIEQFVISVITKNKPQTINCNYFHQDETLYHFTPRTKPMKT